jgi:OmcA/MtrC family decaheme c-type cytochrome
VKLGVKPTFHAGQRNDAPTCVFCHNVNRVNSGWAVNIKEAVHAIHSGAKRVNKFSWEATAGAKYWEITYPGRGMLKNCEMCHAAGMYDFSASAYTANNGALLNNMLFSTAATGTISASAKVIVTGDETISSSDSVVSPFVTLGAGYGSGFSYNAGTGATTAAGAATLVISPVSSACFACHDTAAARSHMVMNGGSIYEPRSTALAKAETCLICHGPAANTAYGDYVPAIKSVHRWW